MAKTSILVALFKWVNLNLLTNVINSKITSLGFWLELEKKTSIQFQSTNQVFLNIKSGKLPTRRIIPRLSTFWCLVSLIQLSLNVICCLEDSGLRPKATLCLVINFLFDIGTKTQLFHPFYASINFIRLEIDWISFVIFSGLKLVDRYELQRFAVFGNSQEQHPGIYKGFKNNYILSISNFIM